MVAERGNGPPWKRSRGERDRSCPGDCELKSRRDSDDATKNEDGFKCGVIGRKAKCPSRINGNFYRAVVEVQKPGSTTTVWMAGAWQENKCKAECDAERLSCTWRKAGFYEVIKVVFCFGDDSHRRDARHSHPCEDRRDAETAH